MNRANKNSKDKKHDYIHILPKDTTFLLEDIFTNKQDQQIENLFLRLYRYAKIDADKHKVIQYFPINKYKNVEFNRSKIYKDLLSGLDKKIQDILRKQGIQYEKYMVSQAYQSRWALGIGGGSPYGNLLLSTLHPLYGFPYIPASTLKGLMRHYWNCCNGDNPEELKRLFGSSEDDLSDDKEKNVEERLLNSTVNESDNEKNNEAIAGQLIFFDSYPSANCKGKIVIDVFTPHYPNYYNDRGKTAPTDDQNPVPIEFLCIENFTFNIYIGSREKLSDDERAKIKNTLNFVLSEQGIGAKTALGYGRGTVNN